MKKNIGQRQKITYFILAGMLIIALGTLVTLKYSGRINFKADVAPPNTISHQSQGTYTDAGGVVRNISSNTVTTEILASLNPPVISTVTASTTYGRTIRVAWDEPSTLPQKYFIYRNGVKIAEASVGTKYIMDYFCDFNYFATTQDPSANNYIQDLTYGIVSVGSTGQQSIMNTKAISLQHSLKNSPSAISEAINNGLQIPSFKNLTVTKNSETSYTINWSTDFYGSTQEVAYGETNTLGELSPIIKNLDQSVLSRSYNITLSQPLASGEYYYFNLAVYAHPANDTTSNTSLYLNYSGVKKFDLNGAVSGGAQ